MKSKKLLSGAIIGIVLLGNIFSPVLAQDDTKPSSKIAIRPVPDFKIDVKVDKGRGESYTVGENITIYFKSNKDSYLTLFEFSPGGRIRLLLPNRYRKDNFFKANREYAIPSASDKFRFEVTLPLGKGMIRAIATTSPWRFMPENEILRYHNEHPEERYPVISSSEEGFATKFNEQIKIVPEPSWAMASCFFYVTSRVVPQYGKIKATSTPSNAKVYLDGSYRGTTPLLISNVKMGEHDIKFTKKNYYDRSKTVQVRENYTTYAAARLEPVPKTGSIYINSTPSNAKAYLDGAYRGRTPLTISNLEVGEYQIRISKDGYYDWYSTVQIKQNITAQVFAQLEPMTGSLYVTSSPRYARVFLDGIERGTTPITIADIEMGWHEVVIIKEYYRAYVEYLYIYAGEETEVEADLDRI